MEKSFGIRVRLPKGDSMSMAHLLGQDWESTRWFASAEKRDRIFSEMSHTPRNYREGDHASVVLEKIDP